MSDGSRPPKGGIPSWQRAENQTPTEVSDAPASKPPPISTEDGAAETESTDAPASKPPSTVEKPFPEATLPDSSNQSELLLKALHFLKDESLKDASAADKIAFLESKGLDSDSIKSIKALLSSNDDRQVAETKQDVTPIITYPEFLMHSNKPPPIVTTQRLLTTAYVATGAAALIYGVSEYLVKPMVENLTSARHDLHEHTRQKMEEFNEKLANIVSVDPAARSTATLPPMADSQQDAASEDSDPTELFHRDYGTQTSADLETRVKELDSDASSEASVKDRTTAQSEKIQRLRALATDLSAAHLASEGQNHQEISTVIRVLNEYLDSMAYPSSSSSYGIYGSVMDGSDRKGNNDEISKIKAEIRGVKGIFLSARNFPGAAAGSAGRAT